MGKYRNVLGPWDNEPDTLQGITKVGLNYYICRGMSHQLCGYIEIPIGTSHCFLPEHALANEFGLVSVENFIIEDRKISWDEEYLPLQDSTRTRWLGFSCDHVGDLIPDYVGKDFYEKSYTYKNIDYVKNYCETLARNFRDFEKISLPVEEIRKVLKIASIC